MLPARSSYFIPKIISICLIGVFLFLFSLYFLFILSGPDWFSFLYRGVLICFCLSFYKSYIALCCPKFFLGLPGILFSTGRSVHILSSKLGAPFCLRLIFFGICRVFLFLSFLLGRTTNLLKKP